MSAAYRAPRLFANPHFATIYAGRIARTPEVAYRRERWDTPDGDFIDLDFVDGPGTAPLLVLFHGLEGSSQSSYARVIMDGVRARGWRGVVPHFRGCSGELNRLPRAYHSGDSAEADWILRRLIERNEGRAVFAAGVSLGGNVLAKWLGECGAEAQALVRRAVAICAPVDLPACGHALGRGFNRVYTFAFLRTLKERARQRLARHPGIFDGEAMERSRTLRAFDDAVTAPLHGFDGVDDYWTARGEQSRGSAAWRCRCSSSTRRTIHSCPKQRCPRVARSVARSCSNTPRWAATSHSSTHAAPSAGCQTASSPSSTRADPCFPLRRAA